MDNDDKQVQIDLQSIRWAGWAVVATICLGWISWISLQVMDNRAEVVRISERQALQYEQLREAVNELKTLIKMAVAD